LYHKDYIKVDRWQECIWVEIRTKPQQTLLNISYISPQFTDRNYWTLFNQSIGLAYISPNLLIVGDPKCVSVKHKISWSNKYKIEYSLFLILLILRWKIASPPEIVSFVSGPGFSSISFASRTIDHKKRKKLNIINMKLTFNKTCWNKIYK
jgi:hypothetical protein